MATPASPRAPVPAAARWLGGAGLIPFAALAVAGPFIDAASRPRVAFALAAYGASILSFLGGIRWGLAIRDASETALVRPLAVSVIPSLVAWIALLLPPASSLALLAAGVAGQLFADVAASRRGETPAWYPALRWPLSCGAALALLSGALWR
jgi:hypothetical protein